MQKVNISSSIDAGFKKISLNACVLEDIPLLSIRLSLRTSSNGCDFCHQLLNHTIDICRILNGGKFNGLVGKVVKSLKPFNIPLKCPIKKVHTYYNYTSFIEILK